MNSIVLIPVHRDIPNNYELDNIIHNEMVLQKHEIKFLLKNGVSNKFYKNRFPEIQIIEAPNGVMDSVTSYNQFFISGNFLNLFDGYDYLLIVEPDAMCLRDELNYWISMEYSYIGAPWPTEKNNFKLDSTDSIGNSGFSLINLSDFRRAYYEMNKVFSKKDRLIGLIRSVRKFKLVDTIKIIKSFILNEEESLYIGQYGHMDDFWRHHLFNRFDHFVLPAVEIALKFSWELHPRLCYNIIRKLPFGIHAVGRYDKEFVESLLGIK